MSNVIDLLKFKKGKDSAKAAYSALEKVLNKESAHELSFGTNMPVIKMPQKNTWAEMWENSTPGHLMFNINKRVPHELHAYGVSNPLRYGHLVATDLKNSLESNTGKIIDDKVGRSLNKLLNNRKHTFWADGSID